METVPTSYTIAEYCNDLRENAIQVERKYQRNDHLWPLQAQSFLIETILLGYPVPKLFLHQVTDRVSRRAPSSSSWTVNNGRPR